MKTISNILTLALLFISTFSFAQNEKYKTAMLKGLQDLSGARAAGEYSSVANHFERIARLEKTEWLPLYYASYSNLISGIMTEDKDVKDDYFDKALAGVLKTDSLSPNNSEIETLKGYIQLMKMSVKPMSRMSYLREGNASLERAMTLNPANPRPYLVKGQNAFYTPAAFGGGKTKAKPILEIAHAKFKDFKAENELLPAWGEARTKELLTQCQ